MNVETMQHFISSKRRRRHVWFSILMCLFFSLNINYQIPGIFIVEATIIMPESTELNEILKTDSGSTFIKNPMLQWLQGIKVKPYWYDDNGLIDDESGYPKIANNERKWNDYLDIEKNNFCNLPFNEKRTTWRNLNSAWGKRRNALNNYQDYWSKREPNWNNLKGMWGKRDSKDWQKLQPGWGKRFQYN